MARAATWLMALCVWLAAAGAATAQTTVGRTPTLGVSFQQDGVRAPLTLVETTADYSVYSLTLHAAPFDISVPNDTWGPGEQHFYLAMALSTDRDFLSHLHIGQGASDTDFLGAYRAMAFDPRRLGELLTAERPLPDDSPNYGFNSVGDDRFDASVRGAQTLHVTAITSRQTLQPMLADGLTATMVFYVDRQLGDPPIVASRLYPDMKDDLVHRDEIAVVRITFVGQAR